MMVVHRRFLVDHRKRHEFREAMRLMLDVSQQVHVFDPMNRRFDMAVHDCRSRGNTQAVRCRDDLNPLPDCDAAGRDHVADVLIENLRRSTRKRAQARLLEHCEIVRN